MRLADGYCNGQTYFFAAYDISTNLLSIIFSIITNVYQNAKCEYAFASDLHLSSVRQFTVFVN